MSEGQHQTPETAQPDGAPATGTASPESADGHLGDAGKRALDALRSENKELKSRLKALEAGASGTRDVANGEGNPAGDTRDVVTAEPETQRPRFQGTVSQGVRNSPPSERQLSKADLSGMSKAAIERARRNGQLRDLLRGQG